MCWPWHHVGFGGKAFVLVAMQSTGTGLCLLCSSPSQPLTQGLVQGGAHRILLTKSVRFQTSSFFIRMMKFQCRFGQDWWLTTWAPHQSAVIFQRPLFLVCLEFIFLRFGLHFRLPAMAAFVRILQFAMHLKNYYGIFRHAQWSPFYPSLSSKGINVFQCWFVLFPSPLPTSPLECFSFRDCARRVLVAACEPWVVAWDLVPDQHWTQAPYIGSAEA